MNTFFQHSWSRWALGAIATLAGTEMLLLRPPRSSDAVLLTAMAGVVGALTPFSHAGEEKAGRAAWGVAFGIGVGAVLGAKILGAGVPAQPFWPPLVLASLLAAVAEEALFRRLLYGLLLPWGAVIATVGSALAFAAVHVPVYGIVILPINIAVGLLLGWQRWLTGSWSAPAATHGIANLMQFI